MQSYLGQQEAVVDPECPIGGAWTCWGGGVDPNVGAFWQKCMQKRKNWVP